MGGGPGDEKTSIDGCKLPKTKKENENARVRKNDRNYRQVAKSISGTLLDAFNGRLGVCSLLQWAKARHRLQNVFLFVLSGLCAVLVFVCAWVDGEGTEDE